MPSSRSPLKAAAQTLLCLTLLLASTSASLADDLKRRISLTGTGTVTAAPSKAHISTGVVSDAITARDALAANTKAMTRIVEELKTQGLDANDIQTSNFSVSPRYQHYKDGRPAEIIGYRVSNSVRITVRDIPKLGTILDKVVTLGSNQISGISFAVNDADKLRDKARADAMADAIRKAELYAKAAGAKVGKVITISENSSSRPPQPVYRARVAAAKASPVPVQAGEQSLQVQVNVTWELE